ncbi:MAG TPA: TolC family protein [Puia sp.]|nr:TolC family protein [Puia sp.]
MDIKHIKRVVFISLSFYQSLTGFSQRTNLSDTIQSLTLEQCINYAMQHQPALRQSLINIDIAHVSNQISLSGWLPQANVSVIGSHYLTLPTSFVKNSGGDLVEQKTGVVNSVVPVFSVSQAIFSPSLLFAARSAHLYTQQASQITDSTKINVVANVSKTFYSLLLTLEQINVLKEDTERLGKNLHDTYHQYISGVVDETDYDEAAISLNNSKAQLKQATENIIPQYAALKQIMGFPPQQQFNVSFDTLQMINDISFDTTLDLQYQKRIEYQQLLTSKKIQEEYIHYYRTAWLPTVSAFFFYDYPYQNNGFSSLFSIAYPYSYLGLSLNLPIFTGFARTKSLQRAKLQQQLLDWDQVFLESEIYSEYTSAMANYKSNFYNMNAMKDNVNLARRTYDIVYLQYQEGVVAYLNVITAESNLISSEIGYLNALFQLLSSKIDLEKSMGIIVVNKNN